VLKAFAVDPPAPEERKKIFAGYLAPNARYRCLRWVGSIESVTPNTDGWEVTVNMMTRLPGTAFLTTASGETWQVSRSGGARCVKCGLGKGYMGFNGGLFID
jgi:hypothetical protein